MKRRPEQPPVDYAVDRNKWAGLVELVHVAAASDTPADLKALSDRALAAETCWTMLAPFPEGLVCRVLSRLAWAYGRQADPALRAQIAPLLIPAAGLVDGLFQRTANAPAPEPEPAAAPAPARAEAPRLPYADA